MRPLREPPISFAHRGASANAPENTLDAFRLALRLGATGLETDVWRTADGVPVLAHDGHVGGILRRRRISDLDRSALPDSVPSLPELYAELGAAYELSIDVKDAEAAQATEAAEAVVSVARSAGDGAPGRLWLCHPDWELLGEWRSRWPDVRLVNSTRMRHLRQGPERRAAQLAGAGVDAVNLHCTDWSAGLTTLFHRFDRLAFGWDAQHERVVRELLAMGIDAVYGDHVDRMTEAFAAAGYT